MYQYQEGSVPLLLSMPHAGRAIPEPMLADMSQEARLILDTDWYVEKLYEFAKDLGVYWIEAEYSRYVIDLNRAPDGKNLYPGMSSTELCPTTTFNNQALYLAGKKPDDLAVAARIETFWQPYHSKLQDTLDAIKLKHGRVTLLEAHTIASEVPRFFSGKLTDFNFGTNDDQSCSEKLSKQIQGLDFSPYTSCFNQRFKGGYITRRYGAPTEGVDALQLELSQATYLNEGDKTWNEAKYEQLKPILIELIETLLD